MEVTTDSKGEGLFLLPFSPTEQVCGANFHFSPGVGSLDSSPSLVEEVYFCKNDGGHASNSDIDGAVCLVGDFAMGGI